MKKDYDPHDLQDLVREKFGTVKELADMLGIEPSNMSRKFRIQSYKFLKELQDHGIDLNRARVVNSNVGNKGDNYSVGDRTMYLEEQLKAKDELIESLKQQILLLKQRDLYGKPSGKHQDQR